MSVALTLASTFTAIETLETNVPAAATGSKSITHSGFNQSFTLNAASSVPITQVAYFTQALTAGAATIDLTALVGTNNVEIDGTGLKVRAIMFTAASGNANPITIGVGASNGYELAGATWEETLKAGQSTGVKYLGSGAPDIGASDCTLDLAGTGTQSVNVAIALG